MMNQELYSEIASILKNRELPTTITIAELKSYNGDSVSQNLLKDLSNKHGVHAIFGSNKITALSFDQGTTLS